jgi:O-antigen ligase
VTPSYRLRRSSILDALELEDYLFLGAVLALPWAFGGVEIWAYRTASFLLVASATVALWRDGWAGLGLGRGSRWLLPALLLGVWAVIQITPLPAGGVKLLSPRADAIYRTTFPGYPDRHEPVTIEAIEAEAIGHLAEAADLPEPRREAAPLGAELRGRWDGWRPLSLLPDAGVERTFWYFALLLGFLVARRRCADAELAEVYRKLLFVMFFGLALFGLLYAATSNGKLYWVRSTLDNASPFGPYVNPTNFAGVMELATPWLAGYTLWAWRRRSPSKPLRETRIPFLAAATLLCLVSALATASKGAAVLLGLSLATLALIGFRSWKARLSVLGVAVVLAGLIALGPGHLSLGKRFQQFLDATGGQVSEVDRLVAWRASTAMIKDFAVTGSGFGSFRDVFPAYLPAGEFKRWYRAHNDYLEVVLEGGAVAAVLLVWLVWGYWRRALRAVLRGNRGRPDLATAGLVLGLLALSVHAFFDFNHQVPANALLFTTLAAIAIAPGEGLGEIGEAP